MALIVIRKVLWLEEQVCLLLSLYCYNLLLLLLLFFKCIIFKVSTLEDIVMMVLNFLNMFTSMQPIIFLEILKFI